MAKTAGAAFSMTMTCRMTVAKWTACSVIAWNLWIMIFWTCRGIHVLRSDPLLVPAKSLIVKEIINH